MTSATAVVFVVDDDPSVRRALGRLFRAHRLRAESFASAGEFLRHDRLDAPACLVLDVQLAGPDGLEVQRHLNESGVGLPIVFITGHGDIPMSVRAMKAGAVDFLTKPFDDEDLLKAVRRAIADDERDRIRRAEAIGFARRAATLTPREREVMALVVGGRLNKQIGRELGVAEKTVKVHRGRVMRKMRADSLADLVRMAERLDLGPRGRRVEL